MQITNAGAVRKESISVPYSMLKHAIAEKLVAAGYVKSAEKHGKKVKKILEVVLRYNDDGTAYVRGVKRVSKPGRRLYTKTTGIHAIKFGKGSMILSTPKGILTGEEARKEKVGGEQLFIIW